MDPVALKRIEIGMKAGVLEYFNLFDKKLFLPTSPYFQLVLDSENDWYFDTINDPGIKDKNKEWSIGFAEGYERYFHLYTYNPYGELGKFMESKWNPKEFSMMIEYIKGKDKLHELLSSIRRFELTFRDTEYDLDEKEQAEQGRFWKWKD